MMVPEAVPTPVPNPVPIPVTAPVPVTTVLRVDTDTSVTVARYVDVNTVALKDIPVLEVVTPIASVAADVAVASEGYTVLLIVSVTVTGGPAEQAAESDERVVVLLASETATVMSTRLVDVTRVTVVSRVLVELARVIVTSRRLVEVMVVVVSVLAVEVLWEWLAMGPVIDCD